MIYSFHIKMSRYGMPIHKFITKYLRLEEPPVVYGPHSDLQHPPCTGTKWKMEIYAQESFAIQPRSSLTVNLRFGVLIRRGMVFVSLKQSLKIKRCSLQDGVVSETVDDIIVTIQNSSDAGVIVNAGESMCFIGTQTT